MPIYEQTYRRYVARGPLRQFRFWPITREALRLILAKRVFLFLMCLLWIPFIIFTGYVYVLSNAPAVADLRRVVTLDGRVFGQFLAVQAWLALLPTIFGGSGLVANDLRTGAILAYLSRPLTWRDYVLGKLGVLLSLNLAVTLAPGLLLYGLSLAIAPAIFANWNFAWIGPAVILQSFVVSLVWSLVALAVSALSKSARVAGIGFFGLILALNLVLVIVRQIYRTRAVMLLSIRGDIEALGAALFGLTPEAPQLHWAWPALTLTAVCLTCLVILRSRVRAVEIVQ